jgi:hypothetical protein
MKTHSRNAVHGTHIAEAVTIMRDATSAPKGLGQKHLEALSSMRVSQSIFGHRAMSSSTMAKPTLAFGWRITALRKVGGVDDDFLSSSSSPFT